jgi:hypothetical protein
MHHAEHNRDRLLGGGPCCQQAERRASRVAAHSPELPSPSLSPSGAAAAAAAIMLGLFPLTTETLHPGLWTSRERRQGGRRPPSVRVPRAECLWG